MSLIVSLRILDGIVIAADSLATTMNQVEIRGEMNVECPQCEHQDKVGPMQVGHVAMPASTFSFAQKIFPFVSEYEMGTYGEGQLAGKTIYFVVKELEQELMIFNKEPSTVALEHASQDPY